VRQRFECGWQLHLDWCLLGEVENLLCNGVARARLCSYRIERGEHAVLVVMDELSRAVAVVSEGTAVGRKDELDIELGHLLE